METNFLGLLAIAIVGIFSVAITTLLGICAYLFKRWMDRREDAEARQEEGAKQLTDVLSELKAALQELGGDFRRLAEDVEGHEKILRAMPAAIHGGCSNEGCPYYDPDKTPVPRHIRTRLTDPKD